MSEIRKFMNLVEYGENDADAPVGRDEAGRVLHPDVTYDVGDTKVVATLRSYKSQSYTKLAQKIEEVEALEQRATELKEQIKQEGRDAIADLFAADDSIRTRVIETVSFIMKLTKDPEAATTVKYEKVVTELADKLTPELKTVLESLVKKYSTVQKPKAAALSYEMKPKTESVDLSEGMWDSIKSVARKFLHTITTWGHKYDAKLKHLEAMVGVQEAMEGLETPALPQATFEASEGFFKSAFTKLVEGEEGGDEAEADEEAGEEPMEESLDSMFERAMAEANYDHMGSDFKKGFEKNNVYGQQVSGAGNAEKVHEFPEMVSKWETPKGGFVYIWRKPGAQEQYVVINGQGKNAKLFREPQSLADLENMLTQHYGCKKVQSQELSLADGEDMAPEADEQGLTEYGEPAEDGYPTPVSLDDDELKSYLGHWHTIAKTNGIDPDSDSGRAFLEFGMELTKEAKARGLI